MNKQIKSLLKSAKQLIQEKNYNEALNQCQNILSFDPKNYNGLVFSGLCLAELNEIERSRKAYHSAIEEDNHHFLAYQGLVNLYAKHWVIKLTKADIEDLISAYVKLIKLFEKQDKSKIIELQLGLAKAYCSNEDYLLCLQTVQSGLQQLQQSGNGDVKTDANGLYEVVIQCLKLATGNYNHLHQYSELFVEVLHNICNHFDLFDVEEYFKYFLLFHQTNKDDVTEGLATIVRTIQWLIANDWKNCFLSRCALQVVLQDSHQINEEVLEKYLESLPDADESITNTLKGYQAYKKNDHETCINLLTSVKNSFPNFLPLKVMLCQAYLSVNQWSKAEKLTRSALQDCKRLQASKLELSSDWLVRLSPLPSIKLQLTLLLAKSLCESQNEESLKLSVGTFEKLSSIWPESIDIYLGIAKAHTALKNYDAAKDALERATKLTADNPDVNSMKAFIRYQEGDMLGSKEDLQGIVTENQNCFLAHFHLARLLWLSDSSQINKAFTMFLKAAKLNIYHGPTFFYIGNYYRDVMNNSSKATRCYEKAYKLGPKNEEIGSALADQYISEGKLSDAVVMYESITQEASPGTCKWAWLRLGLCRLRSGQVNSAIRCLQAALRCDVDDHITWECLGEAYFLRGSYTSAWKSFHRARQLHPTSVFSSYQMAAIKQILGKYDEAIMEYADVLNLSPTYVPALKGLGESHLSLAEEMMSDGRYQSGVDNLNIAIKHLFAAVKERGDLSCVWKLLGDCATIIHPLHRSKVQLLVPNPLLGDTESDGERKLSKMEALRFGGSCYVQALRLLNSVLLWHDLALNYFYRSQEGDEVEGKDMAAKAVQILKKGLSLDEDNHVLWNSLGIIASYRLVQDYGLAQHSFIRSIQCEPNNVAAWSNLGVFYLERSQIELAHNAFKNAQSLQPSFANSWIGQALIAESIGSEDSMDLFRHATELSLHSEASIGYATWVCNIVSEYQRNRRGAKYKDNIHDLRAFPAATVQLSKYCDLHPQSDLAFSLFGFLLEETGLNRSAELAYHNCVQLLQEKLSNCDDNEATAAKLNKARSDYARILFKNAKYKESVAIYQSTHPSCDYSTLCGHALALHACGRYEDAAAALMQAHEAATTVEERSKVAIASAVLCWKRGNRSDSIKQLEHYQKHSLDVLLCKCALGVCQGNDQLLRQHADQLFSCDVIKRDDPDVTYRRCVIVTCALMRVDERLARSFLQRLIHRFPDEFQLRQLLSLLLSRSSKHKLAYVLATQSLLNYNSDERTLSTEAHINKLTPLESTRWHEKVYTNYILSLLANGKHSTKNSGKPDSLRSAQRLIHAHPYSLNSWALLAGSSTAKSILSKFNDVGSPLAEVSHQTASYVSNHSESALHAWAVKQNILSRLLQNKQTFEYPPKVEDPTLEHRGLLALVEASNLKDGNQSTPATSEQLKSASYCAIMLYTRALTRLGEFHRCYDNLSAALSYSTNEKHKFKILVRIALLAIKAATSQEAERCDWLRRADDALNAAGNSRVVELLQGVMQTKLKSYKKACAHLKKVFNNDDVGCLCSSRSIAASYLYFIYHKKGDSVLMQEVLAQWKELADPNMDKIISLLP